ncbi:MAG: site-specific DNA-methyltransferase [Bacteroidales bacterium]|jgi:site-specific DNA-methyltransferase (adenine-specific)
MTIALHYGDCLDIMKEIPDDSVDLILCDLPYGTTNCKWDTVIDLEKLWNSYNRITKDDSAIILFAQTPFDKVLGCSNLSMLKYELIWHKTQPTGHLNAKKMPLKAHENILVFYKKLPIYNPQKTTGHTRKVVIKRNGNKPTASKIYGEQTSEPLAYDSTERYPISVQTFSCDTQKIKFHPTQKPLDLIEWLVLTYSNENSVVLDNCMGSGTTGIVCKKIKRNFIGIEKDKTYFDIAVNRINLEQEENTILELFK